MEFWSVMVWNSIVCYENNFNSYDHYHQNIGNNLSITFVWLFVVNVNIIVMHICMFLCWWCCPCGNNIRYYTIIMVRSPYPIPASLHTYLIVIAFFPFCIIFCRTLIIFHTNWTASNLRSSMHQKSASNSLWTHLYGSIFVSKNLTFFRTQKNS